MAPPGRPRRWIASFADRWPVTGLETPDLHRATELMARYADSDIGFVDAAIAALAERLGVSRSTRSTDVTSRSCGLGTSPPSRCCRALSTPLRPYHGHRHDVPA